MEAVVTERDHCDSCCTRLSNVSVVFGGRHILERVTLHLHCGELIALVGPNGAGKTTLLKAILGEVPYTGEIAFLPFSRRKGSLSRIGYVPQKLSIDPLSPVTVLDLFAGTMSNRPLWLGNSGDIRLQAEKALSIVGAESIIDDRLGQVSGGQLQRVLLALALTPIPEILLLDEPVAGLDHGGTDLFYQMISDFREKYHLAILLISHDLAALGSFADRMVVLNRTILCEGKPEQVLADPRVRTTFGSHIMAHAHVPYRAPAAWHEGAPEENQK